MNKATGILMAVFLVAGPASLCFAKSEAGKATAQERVFKGTIVSLNASKDQVILKDDAGATRIVKLKHNDMNALKEGDHLSVKFKGRSNNAESAEKQ